MGCNIIEHRVRYSDTDHGGVVYYARYLEWFEAGRTEILRDNGTTFVDLEKKGILAPVVEAHINYKKPIYYDELIVIKTKIVHIGNSSIKFEYDVVHKETEEILATGYTINVVVDKEMKPIRVPDSIRGVFTTD